MTEHRGPRRNHPAMQTPGRNVTHDVDQRRITLRRIDIHAATRVAPALGTHRRGVGAGQPRPQARTAHDTTAVRRIIVAGTARNDREIVAYDAYQIPLHRIRPLGRDVLHVRCKSVD